MPWEWELSVSSSPSPLQKGKTGDGIGFLAFVAVPKQGQVVLGVFFIFPLPRD